MDLDIFFMNTKYIITTENVDGTVLRIILIFIWKPIIYLLPRTKTLVFTF